MKKELKEIYDKLNSMEKKLTIVTTDVCWIKRVGYFMMGMLIILITGGITSWVS